ncbi:kinesin heavy chain [Jimgerdemannia flammicorona]|uniref:Kinesin-like protein n=1 Tax=Jimgerdemannia flammicorona TaxID=994334 RepID=A0A433D248_9FUNG|nr:kinesin heavy chain [Jimgerdemannia flammicorona]
MAGNNIKVVCRFRPQNKLEISEGGVPIINIDDEGTSVQLQGQEFQGPPFAFDKVFGMDSKQKDIFDYSIKSIVDDVVGGYNGTVFAYGQTGSGKTFSMMGVMDNDELKGITPRLVEQIFQSIVESPSNMEFTVKVSFMEIYMEKVRDLLAPQNDNLPIHEDKTRGVYVKGLAEVYVSSVDEIHEVMRRGTGARIVAYTSTCSRSFGPFLSGLSLFTTAPLTPPPLCSAPDMNAESSRSHSIFVITVANKNLDTGAVKQGKLHLVDLAGSEKVGKTGASGQTLEEAKKINKSLTALGMVINALTDGKSSHVPYRDSKLTRILQEALGGNSRTTLIINCSPSSYNEAETLSTLRFGMRAKTIKNKAKINADLSPAELKALLKKVKSEAVTFQAYIAALEGEVGCWRAGQTVPEQQWVSFDKISKGEGATSAPATPVAPAPAFKALMMDDSRPATPAIVLEKDEREEFLKRENELTDQISEKETELTNRDAQLNQLKEELGYYKEQEGQITKENQQMTGELNELRLQLQKVSYESKENAITIDSYKETNQELNAELEELKKQLFDLRVAQKESADGEKEKKKAEKMAAMMANFDPSVALANQPKNSADMTEKEKDMERMRKSMAQQLADFEVMKKALMRDLQNRCEKVVELEISLDETREQYNNVLRASNNKAQQKKMAFLERNLEQLTNVQKQLVEQNSSLKKEVAIAERKLLARNERIQSLESLLQEAQDKLIAQNQRFEAQLQSVRDRLEQARSQKSQNAMNALNFGRIAKPMRGGIAVADDVPPSPSALRNVDKNDRRTSWIPGFR